jgi:hypothetical protein
MSDAVRGAVLVGDRQMNPKRFSVLACLLLAPIASAFGALAISTPVAAAIPPAAAVGVNALTNGGLGGGGVSGVPTCWTPNRYGSNTPTFTFSPTGGGADGGEAYLTVTNYTSGTADLISHSSPEAAVRCALLIHRLDRRQIGN